MVSPRYGDIDWWPSTRRLARASIYHEMGRIIMPDTPGAAGRPPAGWYADHPDSPSLRWWDGQRWTAHTQPRPGACVKCEAPEAAHLGGRCPGSGGLASQNNRGVAQGIPARQAEAIGRARSKHDDRVGNWSAGQPAGTGESRRSSPERPGSSAMAGWRSRTTLWSSLSRAR